MHLEHRRRASSPRRAFRRADLARKICAIDRIAERQMLGPHAEHDGVAAASARCLRAARRSQPPPGSAIRASSPFAASTCVAISVHRGRADEARRRRGSPAGDRAPAARRPARPCRRSARRSCRPGHRLDLVVRHVDHRRAEHRLCSVPISMRICDAERRVEVRQRLVEEEHLRARARWRGRWRRAGAGRRRAASAGGRGGASSCRISAALLHRACRSPPCWPARASCRTPCCCRPSCAGRARRTGTPWRCRASRAARRSPPRRRS